MNSLSIGYDSNVDSRQLHLEFHPGGVLQNPTDAKPVIQAVVQSVADFEQTEEERAFMRAVVEGLADLEAEHEVSLAEARKRLGLK